MEGLKGFRKQRAQSSEGLGTIPVDDGVNDGWENYCLVGLLKDASAWVCQWYS